MVISCHKCGRPVCEIDPPAVDAGDAARVLRSLARFGIDLPPDLAGFLAPTPELIGETFKPRCVNGCD